jgi:hypothetical protein
MQRSRAVFITGIIYALIGLVLAGGGIWLAALPRSTSFGRKLENEAPRSSEVALATESFDRRQSHQRSSSARAAWSRRAFD